MNSRMAMIVSATVLPLIGTGGSALAQQPSGIHYQCYQLTKQQQKIPASVHVLDQFNQPNGENAKLLGPPLFLCAPAIKNKEGEKIDLNGPHLLCYRDPGMKAPNKQVTINNQFGSGSLVVGAPAFLCVPTTKKVAG